MVPAENLAQEPRQGILQVKRMLGLSVRKVDVILRHPWRKMPVRFLFSIKK